MTNTIFASASDLSSEDYCVLGLATCFVRDEGEIEKLTILEPIPSAALEALIKGIPTSYQIACSTTLGEIFQDDTVKIPDNLSKEAESTYAIALLKESQQPPALIKVVPKLKSIFL